MYLLNAYKYWMILNEREENKVSIDDKMSSLIRLLIDEPVDFTAQLENLL